MSIEDITLRDLMDVKELLSMNQVTNRVRPLSPWEVGKNYLIRTVSMTQTGRLISVYEHELVLEDAAWIADTGRFSDNLQSCEFSEVEPFESDVIVGRAAIVDATQIRDLPRVQK